MEDYASPDREGLASCIRYKPFLYSAKVGVMRRISMAVLRETARRVARGLDVVGPQCVQARTASRDQSTAAEADHDEGRHAIGSTHDHTRAQRHY